MNGKSSVPPSPSPPPPLQFKHSIIFSSYVSTRSGVRFHLYVPCPVVAGARCESEWSGLEWSMVMLCGRNSSQLMAAVLSAVLSACSGPVGRRKTIDAITHCCLRLSSEHLAPARHLGPPRETLGPGSNESHYSLTNCGGCGSQLLLITARITEIGNTRGRSDFQMVSLPCLLVSAPSHFK